MRTKTIHRTKIVSNPLPLELFEVDQCKMTADPQYFSLRWNNYQSNMTSVFHQLLETQAFVDVSLACEDNTLKAHKVVLSACSAYFKKILLDNPCTHPTIILPSEICFSDLRSIIEFVYRGEIDVSEAELQFKFRERDHMLRNKKIFQFFEQLYLEEKSLLELAAYLDPRFKDGRRLDLEVILRREIDELRLLNQPEKSDNDGLKVALTKKKSALEELFEENEDEAKIGVFISSSSLRYRKR
ncbi:Protein bric-a-brac 1 [Pseudolycoriella hygida]|uniref:Protein bric-a-brac 1 n=1 Tax=Pseudolycoriella hygida TaxID=35572 RepID=A0A9Q0N3K9_9DIPT|nr:Protein bric-a-brac 1 [Pseudolycoriella hygida]